MQRLGVLGGTFDPIHEGHIALARQAMAAAGLDRVLILPMARPAHREPAASAEDRLAMCRLALAGKDRLCLSEAGMLPGVRYTSDAMAALARQYPNARFTLILGADKLPGLPYWYEAERLFETCDFLCFPRAGENAGEAAREVRAAGGRVAVSPLAAPPYASSVIRAQTARYEDAPGLAPQVLCYMAERGLYQRDLLPALQKMMNPRRFRHTLGVRKEAVRLAGLHHLPVQRAALAGLLHDCAKGMPLDKMQRIARENQLTQDPDLLSSGAMLHGPVGAYLAKKKFGVEDEQVLQSIRNHTIGRPGMGMLELCIFVADATEPEREDYPGLHRIRALADISLPAAAMASLQTTRAFLEQSGRPFFPAARQTEAYLWGRLTDKEKQLLQSIQ